MATPMLNRPNGHVSFRMVATTTINLSDMKLASEGTITAASITGIFWTGPWTIARGANTVFITDSNTNGTWDLKAMGTPIVDYNTSATIVCTTASANATLMIQFNKETSANGSVGGQY